MNIFTSTVVEALQKNLIPLVSTLGLYYIGQLGISIHI